MVKSLTSATWSSYLKVWKDWLVVADNNRGIATLSYLSVHLELGYSGSTIEKSLAALSFLFQLFQWQDITKGFYIRKMLKGWKKGTKKHDKRRPVSFKILLEVTAHGQICPVLINEPHCADSPELPDPLAISNYKFHSELGEGTFGKASDNFPKGVFLATLRNKKQNLAIKVIKKTSKISCVKIKTESNVLRIAKENPYLCQGFASFQSQSYSFLIMEFASGGSLWDQIAKYQRLEMSRVLDLKPKNILLDQEGHVKISDFGLALETFGDRVTGYAGTLGYIAPEMMKNEEYDVAVDWWSFGIIIIKWPLISLHFMMVLIERRSS
ncbi:hypothetical protein XELAEV_18005711mg [Xenopus laevis]|uniref:Protein kinase domain-containing protein n=1 Tax=Xenopus laevis TaxID=8355 RepID=A0A974DZT1_XENLA|nr:hypothetical protein XELAEV_18005711mg [Xenopus laevis]